MWKGDLCVLPRAQTAVVSTQQEAPGPSYPAFVVALPQADFLAFHLPIVLLPLQADHGGNSSPEGLSESRAVLGIEGRASTHTGRSHSRAVTQPWFNIATPVAIAV